MKHHEYQIYYGGFKILLPYLYYCKDCKSIINLNGNIDNRQDHKINVPSHKKQTGLPRV